MRLLCIALGFIVGLLSLLPVLLGAVWTLQGLDMLGGSAMSGEIQWAFIGVPVFLSGILLLILGYLLARRGGNSITH